MAVKDYMESEVAVAVAVTAAVFSPRVRRVVRRGLVYGVAGVLKAGDALAAAAQNAARAAEPPAASAAPVATVTTEAAPVMGATGTAIGAVARRAVGAAQQVAASVAHTVQDVAEEAKASRQGSQDLPGVEVRPDA
jgi:hypothetical protein